MSADLSAAPPERDPSSDPMVKETWPENWRRVIGTALLLLEALGLVAVVILTIRMVTLDQVGIRFGAGLTAFVLAFTVALVTAAWSLWNEGRFGLGFGITWQLFQAAVAASMLRSGMIVLGFATLACAVGTFIVLGSQSKRDHQRRLESASSE